MIIDEFREENSFLSNFHKSPITYKSIIFDTVEHFFQAAKTLDTDWQKRIIVADGPLKAKRLARKSPLRDDWEDVKVNVMKHALFLKFTQNIKLGKKLEATGDAILIEKNYWHDCEWGVCTCERCSHKVGKNLLGKLLMLTRYELFQKGKTLA